MSESPRREKWDGTESSHSFTNIHRNIVKEILRECVHKKMKPNENFVSYYVKLLLMDPNWGVTSDFMISRTNVQNFVKSVMTDLEGYRDAKLITLKMQFSFHCNLENADRHILEHRTRLLKKLSPLKTDICRITEITDQSDSVMLLKKITIYVTLLSGLGRPTDDGVYIEALTALKSIMDYNDLREFARLDKTSKGQELEHLQKLVCGIRLFNKDCDKGGIGIPNLPLYINSGAESVKSGIQEVLVRIMESVNSLTTFIDRCCVIREDPETCVFLEYHLPVGLDITDFEEMKELLILHRQYELYVRKIGEELSILEANATKYFADFDRLLKNIHKEVYMKIAVSVSVIFPLFEALSDIWTSLQNQIITLTVFQKIMDFLDEYAKAAYYNKPFLDMFLQMNNSISDTERLEETANSEIKSISSEVEIFQPQEFDNIDEIGFQYLGFCPWKLVEASGALIPGNPNMGIARYRNMNFVFSSPEACIEFSKKPNDCVMSILSLSRKKPQLINFLLLEDQLDEVINVTTLVKKQVTSEKHEDKEVQCLDSYNEVVPPNIDPTYFWNVWDLKREALKLAAITKSKTVSTQTLKFYSKNTIHTQTYRDIDHEIQTNSDEYTNVPKIKRFLYGLRGQRGNKYCTVQTETEM